MADNLLASAKRLWQEAAPDFDPLQADVGEIEMDASASSTMTLALKRISEWMDRAITKFGACAAVADASDVKGLEPVAAEVIKAFVAAIGTMISLRRGAGPSLCMELQMAGNTLATTLDQLGSSVGTPSMALAAGKALHRAEQLGHLSVNNRSAISKRLCTSREQLHDGYRELIDALNEEVPNDEDNENQLEESDCDCSLDAEARRVAVAAGDMVALFKDMLDAISKPYISEELQEGVDLVRADCIETVVNRSAAAVDCIDGVFTHILGGLDEEGLLQSLEELRRNILELRSSGLDTNKLQESITVVHSVVAAITIE
jgi:hypothetical protein